MKMQRSGIRDQGSKNEEQRTEALVQLLRSALPPVQEDFVTARDLWPGVQQKLRGEATPEPARLTVPWFDWALGFGLAALLVLVPAWVPILLYCL